MRGMEGPTLQLGTTVAGERFSLPQDALTQTIAILARRGQGKTYLARGLAEEMARIGGQFVVLDPVDHWWGLRSSQDGDAEGLPVFLFGGNHGDLPIEETAGAVLADTVVETGISAIFCTRALTETGKRRFVADFCTRLYERKGAEDAKTPLHLFLEECQEYVPQRLHKGDERMFGAVRRIVRLGRGDGFGISLISQRPQSINKEVLTQCELLVCFQLTHKLDRKAVDEWVEANDIEDHRGEFMSGLASLQRGEGWVWSPAWLQAFARVRFRQNRTYDSSATPTGESARAEPRVTAQLDLEALRERMAATVERSRQNDPRALRRRVTELERDLERVRSEVPEPRVERIEVPVVGAEALERIEALIAEAQQLGADLSEALGKALPPATPPAPAPRSTRRPRPRAADHPPPPAATSEEDAEPPAEATLRKGARRMLATLVAFEPLALSRRQLGTLALIQPSGGTFSSYLSDLRRQGLVEESGDVLRPTAAGVAYDGRSERPVQSLEDLVSAYKARLKAGARRMFDELLDVYPDGLTRAELAQAAGIEGSGGTFSSYLSDLRRNQLIDEDQGLVRVSDTLYLLERPRA